MQIVLMNMIMQISSTVCEEQTKEQMISDSAGMQRQLAVASSGEFLI